MLEISDVDMAARLRLMARSDTLCLSRAQEDIPRADKWLEQKFRHHEFMSRLGVGPPGRMNSAVSTNGATTVHIAHLTMRGANKAELY